MLRNGDDCDREKGEGASYLLGVGGAGVPGDGSNLSVGGRNLDVLELAILIGELDVLPHEFASALLIGRLEEGEDSVIVGVEQVAPVTAVDGNDILWGCLRYV